MEYESTGIRHIEINKKNRKEEEDERNGNEESSDDEDAKSSQNSSYSSITSDEEDTGNGSSDEDHRSEEKNNHSENEDETGDDKRKQKSQEKSKKVNFDSLLKAVIDISDRIENEEKKLKQFEEKDHNRRYKKHFPPKESRPRTAVLTYRDSDTSFFDENESDNESIPSTISQTSSSVRRRPHSGVQVDSPPSRMNMSFTNDKVRSIDTENQRLLRQLLKTKTTEQPVIKKKVPVRAQSASSINRIKRQQDIDRDNLRFLNKLQSVKPTNSLSRNSLLSEHSKQEQYLGRTRPLSAVSRTKRPISASLRPTSGRSTRSYLSDSASVISTSSTNSRKSNRDFTKVSRMELERQKNWNDRW